MCHCGVARLYSFPVSKYCISDTMATKKLSLKEKQKKKHDFSTQERWQTDSPSLPFLPERQWCQLWQNVCDYELWVVLWLKTNLGRDQRQTYCSKLVGNFWDNIFLLHRQEYLVKICNFSKKKHLEKPLLNTGCVLIQVGISLWAGYGDSRRSQMSLATAVGLPVVRQRTHGSCQFKPLPYLVQTWIWTWVSSLTWKQMIIF